jgi:hypothetical protein
MRWRPALATALYAAFWLVVLFGYVHVNDSGAGYELLRALAVVVPALVLGLYVNRWWVVAAGLVFLLAAALPERTTVDGSGIDVTLTGTYDVSLKQALELLAVTTPWILLGVLSRRRKTRRSAGSVPAGGTP